ncbi:MAG: rhodanese-like domain-containing protein [Candidatus Sumerlaeaceae bacterium]
MKHSPGFLQIAQDSKTRVTEESAEQALARLKANSAAVLVDVREDDEWRAGHIAGARHLGKGVIERDIEKTVPDKTTELHLYCGGGYRSALAADNLQKMGYTNVISIDGGFGALTELGAKTVITE